MQKPFCKRCGEHHWRFNRCAPLQEIADQKAAVKTVNATPVWRTGTPWGANKFPSLDQSAPNVFWRKRDS